MGDGQRHEDSWDLLANQSGFVGEFPASWKVVVGLSYQNQTKTKQRNKEIKGGREGKKEKEKERWILPGDQHQKLTGTSTCMQHTSVLTHLAATCTYICVLLLPSTQRTKHLKNPISFTTKAMSNETQSYLWVRLTHEASQCDTTKI